MKHYALILKPYVFPALMLLLIAGVLVIDVLRMGDAGSISGQDVFNHLCFSVEYYYRFIDVLRDPLLAAPLKAAHLLGLLSTPLPLKAVWHSNFIYFITSIMYFFMGKTLFAAEAGNILYLCVLAASLFLIGKRLSGVSAGLTAAAFTLLYPLIFESARQYGADLPLTAVATLSIYLLLRTELFTSLKYSVLLGFAAGTGMLVKGQMAGFIAAPFAVCCFGSIAPLLKRSPGRDSAKLTRRILHMSVCVLVALALTYIWWGVNFGELRLAMGSSLFSGFAAETDLWEAIFGNLLQAGVSSMGTFPLLLFFAGLCAFFMEKNELKTVCLAWLLFPLCAAGALGLYLWCFYHRGGYDPRHLMPLLPVMALISARGIFRIRKPLARTVVLAGTLCYLCLQFYVLSFGGRGRPHVSAWFSDGTEFGAFRGKKHILQVEELMNAIIPRGPAAARDKDDTGRGEQGRTNILTVLLTSVRKMGPFELRYWFRSRNRDFELYDISMPEIVLPRLDSMDYIIFRVPEAGTAPGWPALADALPAAEKSMDPLSRARFLNNQLGEETFKKLYSFRAEYSLEDSLPFGDYAWLIYKRKTPRV